MRELKFRAWHKTLEYMIVHIDSLNYFNNKLSGISYEDRDETNYDISINNIILMQFTGLKDKNGKEIYEGDIVNYIDRFIFKIIYIPTKACFSLEGENRFMDIMATVHENSFTELYENRFEVIGNIYENSDLLKQLKV